MVNPIKTICLGLLCLCMAHAAFAKVTAKLNRTVISESQSAVLTLTVEGNNKNAKPDITPLQKIFDVYGGNKSSQNSWINGRSYSSVTWTYELVPKITGTLTVPSITVGSERTKQLILQVRKAGNDPSQGQVDPIFVEMSTESEEVYVQEEFILSIRINTTIADIDIQNIGLNVPDGEYEQLSSTQYRRTIKGTPYQTMDILVAVKPQKSGQLTIPRASVVVVKPDNRRRGFFGMGGGTRERLHSNPLTINVKPIPQGHTGTWLPAKSLTLKQTWSKSLNDVNVGDSITRTFIATAEGLDAKQLPQITMQAHSAYKVYPDKPDYQNKKTPNGINGTRTDKVAVVFTTPGKVSLPAITLEWFDVVAKKKKTATLPAVTIDVKGSIAPTPPAVAQQPQTPLPPTNPQASETAADVPATTNAPPTLWLWQIATGILGIGCVLFFVLWLRAESKPKARSPEPTLSEKQHKSIHQAYHDVVQACQVQDNWKARRALIRWAGLTWPTANIRSLADIQRTQQVSWADCLGQLDEGNVAQGTWQNLSNAITSDHNRLNDRGQQQSLGPLYPTH